MVSERKTGRRRRQSSPIEIEAMTTVRIRPTCEDTTEFLGRRKKASMARSISPSGYTHRRDSLTESLAMMSRSCEDHSSLKQNMERLRGTSTKDPSSFPLDSLAPELKVKILEHLPVRDRGRMGLVNKQWRSLTRTCSLWSRVDLTEFPLCYHNQCKSPQLCYSFYKKKVKSFIRFLISIKPNVKNFTMAFDLQQEHEDGWKSAMEQLLGQVHCTDLVLACLNWTDTPVKPLSTEHNKTWGASDLRDMRYNQRLRQRKFINFFDYFTSLASNVRSLCLPFDWSDRSMLSLSRLSNLECLSALHYGHFKVPGQKNIDRLFSSLPNLKSVSLQVVSNCSCAFSIRSNQLESMDLSSCRGINLIQLRTPNLTSLKLPQISRSAYVCYQEDDPLPCVADVIKDGAPNVHLLNGSSNFDDVLSKVCACSRHSNVCD